MSVTVSPAVLMDAGIPLVLTTSYQTAYTCPPQTVALMKAVTVAQAGSAAGTVTLNIVPSGASPTAANIQDGPVNVAPGRTYISYPMQNQVLRSGDTVRVIATLPAGAALNLRMSGLVYVTSPT